MTIKTKEFESFWQKLEAIIGRIPSNSVVFNQYLDCNVDVDVPNGASIRKMNLRTYMETAAASASVLIVGEAAGPWGTRFSGVPFTGERQLITPSFPIIGKQSSKAIPSCPTRVEPPYISRSAEVFWNVMLPYYPHFMVWDAFPLHSHEPNKVLSVRNPTKKEVSQFGEALCLIKSYLKPTRIIAVGKKAFKQLEALGETSTYVRHPSRGGREKFATEMQRLFESDAKALTRE